MASFFTLELLKGALYVFYDSMFHKGSLTLSQCTARMVFISSQPRGGVHIHAAAGHRCSLQVFTPSISFTLHRTSCQSYPFPMYTLLKCGLYLIQTSPSLSHHSTLVLVPAVLPAPIHPSSVPIYLIKRKLFCLASTHKP